MKKALFLLFFLSTLVGQTQLAPNFVVQDLDGTEHRLYEDYLDEGQTVVLSFFYSDCSICANLFYHLEYHLSSTWASLPVDALIMSGVDNNDQLTEYQLQSGVDLPFVAADGGSLEAMAPYMNPNEWGTFYGYPMFIVIGPNRDLVYDPWGQSIEETMGLVGDAIAAVNTVGTEENGFGEDFQVFQGRNGIELRGLNAAAEVFIHDIQGRELFQAALNDGAQSIPFTPLNSQILLVSVLTSEGKKSQRIFFQAKD